MKLIILDRDGVINYDSENYIRSPEDWIPIPGSLEAIARLTKANYYVVVATNQAGVGRGYYDESVLQKIHEKMQKAVTAAGGKIDGIFFCPHHPDDQCACRKPKPGLLFEIARQLKVELTGVPLVGDSLRDIQAAQAVGCDPILVKTGNGLSTLANHADLPGVKVFEDLAAVANALTK
jgi:D-glycero-D-manno-heptose 1,7-bisphosphate phosphatase